MSLHINKLIPSFLVIIKMKSISLISYLIFTCVMTGAMSLHLQDERALAQNIGDKDKFLKDSHNYFVSKENNLVWAGALTLAWHELTDSVVKQDIKLNRNNNVVNKMVQNYNQSPFTKRDLSDQDYYIKSGYGQQTVDKINRQVKAKFPNKTFSDINEKLDSKDIISYAYLAKNFQYPVQFKVNKNFMFKNKTVNGFQADSDEHRKQVNYFYYQNENQFLISLKTKKQNEGVFMLRTKNDSAKVDDIIQRVIKQEKGQALPLTQNDLFEMPVIDLDYSRDVSQLQGAGLLNQNFTDYKLSKVYQALKLKIDETGVKVQNEGVVIAVLTSAMIEPPVKRKYFILNDTFWIILKETGKYPYLCIKVNQPKQKQNIVIL